MEEKSSLAPWEELTQVHEQVSKPSEENHPAEHIAQAHEGIKEIKEEPVLGAVVGGKLGATFAGGRFALEHAVDLAKKRWGTTTPSTQAIPKTPSVNISNPVVQGAGAKGWLGSLTGTNIPGGQMSKESLDTANRLASIVQPGGEFAGGELRNGIALPPDIRAKKVVPNVPPSTMQRYLHSIGNYTNKASPYVKNVVGGAGRLLGPVAAGAGAGYQGLEAAQRFQTGDPTGGVINLVGSAGSLASLYPPTMVLGTGTAMGAEALNAYRDKLRSGEIKHEAPNYENINPMGDTYAQGGLAHLADGGQPPETYKAFGKPLAISEDDEEFIAPEMQNYYKNEFAKTASYNKDLNINNPEYTKGVDKIKLFFRSSGNPTLGYYKPFADSENIYVASDLVQGLPHVIGHEAQHLQDNLAYDQDYADRKNQTFTQRLDRLASERNVNRKALEDEIENNFQKYKQEWQEKNSNNIMANQDRDLGYYASSNKNFSSEGKFPERFADFAGIDARLPRGESFLNTPLGKAVFNKPELQEYYNTRVRPFEVKAIPGNSPTSPTADFIRKLQSEAKLHFKNSNESYADALLNTIKGTLK